MDPILTKEEEDAATVYADIADAVATTADAAASVDVEDRHQEIHTTNNSREEHLLRFWIPQQWDPNSLTGLNSGIIIPINCINRTTKATPTMDGGDSPTLRGIVIFTTGSRCQAALLSNRI